MSIFLLGLLSCNNDDNDNVQKEDTDINNLQLTVTTLPVDYHFSYPYGLTVDNLGDIYVVNSSLHEIVKIDSLGAASSLAGSGDFSSIGGSGYNDAVGVRARFDSPTGITIDGFGDIYVTDTGNFKIRKITPDGVVDTFSENNSSDDEIDKFRSPWGIAIDDFNNVYVADATNDKIFKITSDGIKTTFAGSGFEGSADGIGTSAEFNAPLGVAIDGENNVYVTDVLNHKIRKITPNGTVTTFAGSGQQGDVDGIGTSAEFNKPDELAIDYLGNIYVVDSGNYKIRKISPDGTVTTFAGDGKQGYIDGLAKSARFRTIGGIAVDQSGNVYITETSSSVVRKISLE